MHSCLYNGFVRHRRRSPVVHAFDYPVFMFYLDLDELESVFAHRWLWSATRRPAIGTFRRQDYLGDNERPLVDAVRDVVAERVGRRPRGAVRLLTQLRYFGYGFNPVSFYYCFDDDGTTSPMAIIAEINNTPWGEQHCYVLPVGSGNSERVAKRFEFAKDFHISPFMSMDLRYDWRFTDPGETLVVHMENYDASAEKIFDATLSLKQQPLTTMTLNAKLVAYPFASAQVIGRIYWNALKLHFKGAPYHEHPRYSERALSSRVNP